MSEILIRLVDYLEKRSCFRNPLQFTPELLTLLQLWEPQNCTLDNRKCTD